MNHLDHLQSLIDLDGLSLIDVGAGDGKFARAYAKRGAQVIGIEIDDAKVEIAKRAAHPNVQIRLGQGEDLPIDDEAADLLCFMFSMHHIPDNLQDQALAEAHRVLKPSGRLHVVEPRPFGTMTEAMADLDDETDVRTKSQERLGKLAAQGGFELRSELEYGINYKSADFQAFVDSIVAVDPRRAKALPAVRAKMEAMFHRVSERVEDGFLLEQPCVAYHFEKVAKRR